MRREELNRMPARVIFWGGAGAAKEARPAIEHWGSRVVAVFDDTPGLKSPFDDVPIYCGYPAFTNWIAGQKREDLGFCIAIGNPHGRLRLDLHERLSRHGLSPVTFADPSAIIAADVVIGEGSHVLAGAIIDAGVSIGRQCLVNCGAVICHETVLEDAAEVGPGATVCGLVRIGKAAWVGAGATVQPRARIGADAIVGAGAMVKRDVEDGAVVVGNPARVLRRRETNA